MMDFLFAVMEYFQNRKIIYKVLIICFLDDE